jgi:hypothetical protein
MCPFCQRSISTDFASIMMHAEPLGSTSPNVGENINKYAFMSKHKAFDIHLRRLHKLAIERGDIPPPKIKLPKNKGRGCKKERKRHRHRL